MAELDELCASCSKVDVFSLFTGPRYYPGDGFNDKVSVSLGTLAEVYVNSNCPFCRLLKHILYQDSSHGLPLKYDSSHSNIGVRVCTYRADYFEELKYTSKKTRDMVATKLMIRLYAVEGFSGEVPMHPYKSGIQLLSPDYVDPTRPLLNGYLATTMRNNFDLLKKWMDTCHESHTIESEGARGTCCRSYIHNVSYKYEIKLIDVESRIILKRDSTKTDYAALSYVWGRVQLPEESEIDGIRSPFSALPPKVPKIIDDAIAVCVKLSIPYLWVDRYCIDQSDPDELAAETQRMGYRYHDAKITLIGGAFSKFDKDSDIGLLSSDDIESLQRIEMIQGRKYITSLPSIQDQIHSSPWSTRAWTMQEGQLSIRCAFFGNWDTSFLCISGHWRESLHSGQYAHEATQIPGVDMTCEGWNMLSWLHWLNDTSWSFEEYNSLVMSYTPRKLTFDNDKIKAIAGALNLLSENKGITFVYGLPTTDFHYALLWIGEYDQSRTGFPSWSWAGWHCLQQSHSIYPKGSSTCSLKEDEQGNLRTIEPVNRDIELAGLFISLTERASLTNKCSQQFANITLISSNDTLAITSEVAHFSINILPLAADPENKRNISRLSPYSERQIPFDFDSRDTPDMETSWDPDSSYLTPYDRLQLEDAYGNIQTPHYPRWYDHWPPFQLNFPEKLRGPSLIWLLREGIEMIRILEVELLEGDEALQPFHLVLCLGIDRRDGGEMKMARRFGMFCLPKDVWVKAHPVVSEVVLG
ncbi:hypothetical protein NHQ30_009856 [Ciborinia camelliae]|nr:hypothetical protein NHQ30_009856 [Ciborinia camelliae]